MKFLKFIAVASLLFVSGCAKNGFTYNSDKILKPKSGDISNENYQLAINFDERQGDLFYRKAKETPKLKNIKGVILPHHLVGGYIPATFFKLLEQNPPKTLVIIGPNHFGKGQAEIISTLSDWKTPFGIVKTNKKIVEKLKNNKIVNVDEKAIAGEHSLANIISFVGKLTPKTEIVPIMIYEKTDYEKIDGLVESLIEILPKDSIFISSIDFSHYQNFYVSNFHDELSRAVIKNFDYSRLGKLEIDSVPSLYFILKAMESYGCKKVDFEVSDNLANITTSPYLKSGTSYYSPYFSFGESTVEKTASILNFGDMMLDRNVRKAIDANSVDYILQKLSGEEDRFFKGMDAVSANLEGPFADKRRPTSKSIAFRFDPDLLPMLKKYNFSIFSNANNHTLDMGAAGFAESKQNLAKAGFDFYGEQYKVNEESSLLIKKIGDFDFGFIGFNDTNSPADIKKITDLIKKIKYKTIAPAHGFEIDGVAPVDFVVINAHWGEEYKELSNNRQRALAKALIDAGADVVIGHHPHVVQEMEIYKNRPIFYSLGNFVFDQYFSVPTQQGLGIGLVFHENNISVYVLPIESVKSQVKQMDYEKAVEYLKKWQKNGRIHNNNFDNFNLKINIK